MCIGDIGIALFGVRHCSLTSPEWTPIIAHWLDTLFTYLSQDTDKLASDFDSYQLLLFVFLDTSQIFSDVMLKHGVVFQVIRERVLLQEYTLLVDALSGKLIKKEEFKSRSEKVYSLRIQKFILNHFQNVTVRFNEFVYGFECDVLLYKDGKPSCLVSSSIGMTKVFGDAITWFFLNA
jgi:hypothetical protein